ncbi:hypothetical protein Dtox_3717 [Desulfofarcimen acetoxidans DSM 771]|uniref:Uncharacterized protein n=1 Tax=Desulfofarcimen acetoxidans (strain ATCC 49208 / DSM 771 / KCTC 5769 / VKM B-1644 / 5575) TaxID=485916 RepID=C8VWR1_DESAS|nr:hypothetical protein Dtox_3717 [Desulfofarcimen acetoxidans DSM 771]
MVAWFAMHLKMRQISRIQDNDYTGLQTKSEKGLA